ncbi:MAG: PIG-L deacetylase family protein [Saprospiraceae bacterium]|nr:PIG-L deacetylase family protein [Saprospiraceae bacterium]
MKHIEKALVLAPHTDDGELGCGATIARLIAEGTHVYYAAFSTADQSVPSGFPPNQLEIEVREATQILGIPEDNLRIYQFEVRKLNYVRQEVLELLIALREEIRPDLVFLPSSKDIHQDHLTVYHEGIRAFKFVSILGYELIWNNLSFSTDCFIEVDEAALDKKLQALHAYRTQHGKSYMAPEFIRSMATVRGTQIGVRYAEAFEVIRWIM